MNIIFLGPQGSGKGTQAKMLAQKFGLFYLSSGEMFREMAANDPHVAEILKGGSLLPDDFVLICLEKYLENRKLFDNLIIDGTPRSVFQYRKLGEWLARKGRKIDLAILLNVSREESIRRLSARRQDRRTGKIYNLITNVPGPEVNPEDLVQRDDDRPEAIAVRLDEYQRNISPLVSDLKSDGILVEVDGERPIETIHKDLIRIVEEKRNAGS